MREATGSADAPFVLDPRLIADYLAAIRGVPVSAPTVGTAAPPLIGVVAAQDAARRAVVDVVAEMAAAGVLQVGYAGELLRAVEVGEALWAAAHVDVGRSTPLGRLAELRVSLTAADGGPVGGFRAALVLFTFDDLRRARSSGFLERRRQAQPAPNDQGERTTFTLDADAVGRYAVVSGDDNPVHLDESAARRLGLPGTIVHGMLVLAAAVDHATASLGGNATARVRTVSTRFTTPVLTGEQVAVTWARRATTSGEGLAFRARTESGLAMKGGVVELAGMPVLAGGGRGAQT